MNIFFYQDEVEPLGVLDLLNFVPIHACLD